MLDIHDPFLLCCFYYTEEKRYSNALKHSRNRHEKAMGVIIKTKQENFRYKSKRQRILCRVSPDGFETIRCPPSELIFYSTTDFLCLYSIWFHLFSRYCLNIFPLLFGNWYFFQIVDKHKKQFGKSTKTSKKTCGKGIFSGAYIILLSINGSIIEIVWRGHQTLYCVCTTLRGKRC